MRAARYPDDGRDHWRGARPARAKGAGSHLLANGELRAPSGPRTRARLDYRGIGVVRVLAAALVYVSILHTHAMLIGASPMP